MLDGDLAARNLDDRADEAGLQQVAEADVGTGPSRELHLLSLGVGRGTVVVVGAVVVVVVVVVDEVVVVAPGVAGSGSANGGATSPARTVTAAVSGCSPTFSMMTV